MIVRPTSPRRRSRGWPLFGAVAIVVACLAPMLALAQDDGCRAPALDLANACLLASGVPVRGLIEQPGGSNAFRFEIGAAGGQASLVLDDLPADYDLYLTDDLGSILGQSVHDGTASEELLIRLPAGTYYAVVQSDPAREIDASRPYTLRLTVTALPDSTAPLANRPTASDARRVLLADNFDDPRNGLLPSASWNTSLFEAGYVDEEYKIKKVDATEFGRGVFVPGNLEDAILAVDVRVVGDTLQRRIRLQCRTQVQQDPTKPSNYAFRIFPGSREYDLYRSDLGQDKLLVPRQFSPAINRGNEWNHLELSCIGSTISARVNGQEVLSFDDGTYRRGQMALIASGPASGSPPIEARFDNLVVYAP